MDLIYINSAVGSVFPSQVIDLLNFYKNLSHFNKITLICGIRNESEMRRAEGLLASASFNIIFYRTFPNYPFYNQFAINHLSTAIRSAVGDKSTIFHIRGWTTASIFYRSLMKAGLNNSRVLIDLRGALKEEVLDFQKNNWLQKTLKVININKAISALNNYSFITVVSPALKEYVLSSVNSSKREIFITPCLAGKSFFHSHENRIKYRRKLGLNETEKLIVFSSGGESLWQNNQELFKIANRGFKVLNLSKVLVDHPNVITKYVKYEEVSSYMSAADIAVILREKNIVNEVASPVKFSEYVCTGLPVISNKNVAVIKQYIKDTGFGLLINSVDDINREAVDKLSSLSRNKITEYGQVHFGIGSVAERYINIYKEIVKEE